ncbi:hypothetical protein, partial [Herbaspirillum sp. VT-16-41]|uniref:hypothetical protein n=1 Tax=Herbaspirillum sp. VT-16-41 TaxID=1953765 RepID=UPI0009C9EAD1
NAQSSMKLSDFIELLTQKRIMVVIAFLLFYVAAEAAFLNFFPIFYAALDIADLDAAGKAAKAAYVISSFAGLFTIGRVLGGFITLKLGERRTLIWFSILSLVSIIVSRMLVVEFVYLFMLFGFAMSVLFDAASVGGSEVLFRRSSDLAVRT